MITHAGDTSNLILDPDLDSYYLMDVTLIAMPQMQDRIARIGVDMRAHFGAVELTQEQRIALGRPGGHVARSGYRPNTGRYGHGAE